MTPKLHFFNKAPTYLCFNQKASSFLDFLGGSRERERRAQNSIFKGLCFIYLKLVFQILWNRIGSLGKIILSVESYSGYNNFGIAPVEIRVTISIFIFLVMYFKIWDFFVILLNQNVENYMLFCMHVVISL